jgi:hypothetical protein
MREWITIKEAQEEIVNWSDRKFRNLRNEKKILSTQEGPGAEIQINVESLRKYLESLCVPMGL